MNALMKWFNGGPAVGMRQNASGFYDNGGTTTNPADWLVSYVGGSIGGKTTAGVAIDEKSAEGIPAIYACVHVISETVGQLPLKLFRTDDNGKNKSPDPEHPLYIVLHDLANPELSAMQFREMQTRHLAI